MKAADLRAKSDDELKDQLGLKHDESDQPTEDNHADLHQWCLGSENRHRRKHRDGGALSVRTQSAGHAPYRLRDNRDGNHLEAVQDAVIDGVLERDDTVAERNQGKCRWQSETKPSGNRAQQPGSR